MGELTTQLSSRSGVSTCKIVAPAPAPEEAPAAAAAAATAAEPEGAAELPWSTSGR
jgi:3-oxoacyl-ACP reductase-like protein